jgi:hypothetical protein
MIPLGVHNVETHVERPRRNTHEFRHQLPVHSGAMLDGLTRVEEHHTRSARGCASQADRAEQSA